MTIRFENVRKVYGGQTALDDLSLTLASQKLTVLVGPSGSGKSTLLRTINHLVKPSSGAVYLDDRRVDSWKPEELRRRIGYGIQSVGLFPHHSVGRNIGAVPTLLKWPKARIADRVDELLHLVGLPPDRYRGRYPHQLSGGEAQRVGVARALAGDPPLLLLDEPFSAVDPVTRLRLQAEFLSIQKALHKTIVFVTHDVDEAVRLADSMVLLDQGRLVQHDTPEVLLDRPATVFAARFLGSDRALKRLSRRTVGELARPAPHALFSGGILGDVIDGPRRSIWLVDEQRRLLGSLDLRLAVNGADIGNRLSPVDDEWRLLPESSLREALSIMVGTGLRTLPIVDTAGRLSAEIQWDDVERAGQTSSGHP